MVIIQLIAIKCNYIYNSILITYSHCIKWLLTNAQILWRFPTKEGRYFHSFVSFSIPVDRIKKTLKYATITLFCLILMLFLFSTYILKPKFISL